MTYQPEEGWKTMLVCGVIMIVAAIVVFHRAQVATELHQVVRSYPYATWMSPVQAYIASGLTFGGGVVAIALSFRAYRRSHARDNEANI